MGKARRKNGFTLAEMLIVVGILGILMAFAFIGITGYLRSMTKLEYDGYAREIFVAAQNHLAVVENQGYYGFTDEPYDDDDKRTDFGFPENDATSPGVYYFVVLPEDDGYYNPDDSTHATLLGQMLPFGSVEETVRKGNSGYIIRYHKDSAQVLDVFYWTQSGSRYSHTYVDTDYAEFLKNTSRSALRKYGKSVIGYYGGEEASGLERGDELKAPEIHVYNEDKLYVTIKENNASDIRNKKGYALELVITGKTSNAKKEIILYSTKDGSSGSTGISKYIVNSTALTNEAIADTPFVVVLDDVTEQDMHFADFAVDGGDVGLIPGEDISIQAVASNNDVLTNVAYSTQQTTNSLFGAGSVAKDYSGGYSTAIISSIRHLENLDPSISTVNKSGSRVLFSEAEQSTDLSWTAFKNNIFTNINIGVIKQTAAQASKSGNADGIGIYGGKGDTIIDEVTPVKGYFYPLSINTSADLNLGSAIAWTYKGQMHVISDVDVYLPAVSSFSGAGLFAEITGNSDLGADFIVKDLQLVDFSVKTDKDVPAGSLAGTISNAEITNVVAYHKAESDAGVMSVNGVKHTGGLIGYATNSKIYKSAAALKVSTTGDNAGGLIGYANGKVDIYSCFSGGHTTDGEYKPVHDSVKDDYNVKAKTNAGGLIGKADDPGDGSDGKVTSIRYSYSTCSAMATGADGGTAVGGLVGSIMNSGSSVKYCYSTGLVNAIKPKPAAEGAEAPKVGALIGDLHTSLTLDHCYYYQIINSVTGNDGSISYLPQLGKAVAEMDNKVTVIDATATTYDSFVGSGASGTEADRRWRTAYSYDEKLRVFYQGKFNLRTVGQMKALRSHVEDAFAEPKEADGTNLGDFVIHHYGDWPAPETWVFNTPG